MEPQLRTAAGGEKASAPFVRAGKTRGCRRGATAAREGAILTHLPLARPCSHTGTPARRAPTCAGARRALARG